jgi:tetraacyldisaccharide 4'-kinase
MKEVSLHSLSASRFLAFAGLARPQAFFDRLKEKSIPVGCEMAFPDHFLYGKSDLRELERTALHQGCDALITTEKDIVKVPSDWESRIPLYMTELSIELARVSLAAPLQTGILADLKIVDV